MTTWKLSPTDINPESHDFGDEASEVVVWDVPDTIVQRTVSPGETVVFEGEKKKFPISMW
jgi:hypothetical protein